MNLKGKIALITGSTRGIGKAIALSLAGEGADIIVTGRDSGLIDETKKEIENLNRKAMGIKVDVSNYSDVERMIEEVIQSWGQVDILVNNAGITRDKLLVRMTEEDFDSVLAVNLKGTFNCTKGIIKYMIKRQYGRIVNITSMVGAMGNVGQANYVSSKAGVIGFTKAVAMEYASRGITVNGVAPGYIDSDMTAGLSEELKKEIQKQIPQKRFGTPADVANAVKFFVSDHSSYITGQIIHVNGGMLMP